MAGTYNHFMRVPLPVRASNRTLRHAWLLLVILAALPLLSPANLQWLVWRGDRLDILLPTPAAQPLAMWSAGDMDGDGTVEALSLLRGSASIRSGSAMLWQSPAAWRVTQAMGADLTRDGRSEVALVVWRPFSPWPIDAWLQHGGRVDGFHDGRGQSCHLILVGWKGGRWRELWAGSALADPLLRIAAADMDSDGEHELLALEGRYSARGSAASGRLSLWKWNGFGFTRLARAAGTFSSFTLLDLGGGRQAVVAQASWR